MRNEGLHNRLANVRRRTATAALVQPVLLLALGALATVAHAQTYTYSVLYRFAGAPADGANAYGGVVRDAAGNLYGTTTYAGAGYGTVFKIDTSNNESLLHSFNLTDGSGPVGTLARDAAGNLYGITGAGGGLSSGTVFKLGLDGSGNPTVFSVLHDVPAQPRGGLIVDAAGHLYGTTYLGGDYGNGTVFKVDTTGNNWAVLHSFGGTSTDGMLPDARLVLDAATNTLYGTTTNGGANKYGTVFKVDTSGGNYAVLHSFTNTDGAYPSSGLILAAGNLYGATDDGGPTNNGTVYTMTTAGALTTLHNFTGNDGTHVICDLVRDAAGNLFGTTELGGGAFGTVFKLATNGTLTTLHTFGLNSSGGSDYTDGNNPVSGVMMDAAGNLYGTTIFGGGPSNNGTVFKLTASAVQELDNFTAQVIVANAFHATAVSGHFKPTSAIDPASQAVVLSVAGTNTSTWTFAPGSFRSWFGSYIATARSGSTSITMVLAPHRDGSWEYSAGIFGFVPGSTSVTVTLTIGGQTGSATVNAHVY